MKKTIRVLALLTALASLFTGCAGAADPTTAIETTPTTAPAQTDAPAVNDTLKVYCFQAGAADAFLLWNEAGAILLDTGESGFGKVILAKLQELGIEKLDYLIITHFDKDHVGGAKKVLESIPVDTVIQSNSPKTGASAYEKYVAALETLSVTPVTLREELTFSLGDAVFTLNPPALEVYPQEESNNSSRILTVTHGANRLLFCGDAEDLRLAEFLATDPAPCVFVKLPHHGRYQQTLLALLTQTAPAYGLITSSEEEPEDRETLELLEASGVQTFLTRAAPVLLTSDGTALTAAYTD